MSMQPEPRRRETMRQVNEMIRETLARGDRQRPIAFFCECADPYCYQPVWLELDVYEQARLLPGWAPLAPGHAVSDADDGRRAALRLAASSATTIAELEGAVRAAAG